MHGENTLNSRQKDSMVWRYPCPQILIFCSLAMLFSRKASPQIAVGCQRPSSAAEIELESSDTGAEADAEQELATPARPTKLQPTTPKSPALETGCSAIC
mgnify:CR=1 FL=1